MLRAELLDFYAQFVHQRLVFAPVAVGRVQNNSFSSHRNREKLPVRPVKPVLGKFFKPSPIIIGWRNRDPSNPVVLVLVVEYMPEEGISNAWISRQAQMICILLQNETCLIDGHGSPLDQVFQSFHTSQLAQIICVGCSCVRGYRDVGIHDECRHADCSIFLLKEALVIAAISPISSPKNW